MKKDLFPEFDALYPGKFNNKTNGITPRRWLLACNPRLSELITSKIGHGWEHDLDKLRALEAVAEDPQFQVDFMNVKQANKVDLARIIKRDCGVAVNPTALFDVHVKRLHEYKRQHLNLLHILALYRRLLQDPSLVITPRVFVFAAKAAPGYDMAKCIIKAINAVGKCINNDKRIEDRIKVVFLPNYRVSLAQRIVPAADLSEQISTAGKEASGTGNMKLALNGALTIGTLDGANVEIKEEVGDENIFIFGLTVEEVHALLKKGYNPQDYYLKNEELRAVVDWVGSNYFTPDEPPGVLSMLRDNLYYSDPFLCLPDFESYSECQKKVDVAFRESRAGRKWPYSTRREWENSQAIVRSANMRATSGIWIPCRFEPAFVALPGIFLSGLYWVSVREVRDEFAGVLENKIRLHRFERSPAVVAPDHRSDPNTRLFCRFDVPRFITNKQDVCGANVLTSDDAANHARLAKEL